MSIRLLLSSRCCCTAQHATDTQTLTLSVEPLNWMPLKASALLASCTLRSLMNA